MLARFRSSTNAVPTEQITRTALLLPDEGHGLSVSQDLAQMALARGTNLPMSFAERLARIVGSQGTNATNRISRRSNFSERLAAIVQIAATNQTNRASGSSTNGGPTTRSTSFTQRLEQIASSPDVASYVNSTNGRRALAYYGGRSAIFFTMGLADYRAGRFTNAVAWMQQANASSTGLPPSLLDGQLRFVLAMALFGNGQFDQAQAALAEGVRFVQTNLPAATDADPGTYWDQVLMTRILMREAKATIEQPAPRPAAAP
jgi:tetratricopeptide (TPR) repeat protein